MKGALEGGYLIKVGIYGGKMGDWSIYVRFLEEGAKGCARNAHCILLVVT